MSVRGNPVSVRHSRKSGVKEIRCQFVKKNPVSVRHSCPIKRKEIRCQFVILGKGKSGVSSSFLLEKMNRHRIAHDTGLRASAPDCAHHLEHRVESHIFLCVLAYHLLVAIETTLQRQEIHTSWATVRDLLATHQIATIVLPTGQNGVLRIRRSPTPEPDHRVLYEALGVPTEIIRPVKTWERNQPNSD